MNTSVHSSTEEGDIKIIVGDRIFTCHKEVLANASNYFASMFSGNYKEKDEDSIVLHLDPTTFEEVRNGIYEGKINITQQNACKLLQVCQYLELSNFEKSCVSFIEKNLNVDDLLQALNYAFLFKNTSLFNTIVKHIAENFKQISNRENFSDLEFSIFEAILSHEKLNRNDDAVMLTIAKWVKKNSYRNPTITEKILLAAKPSTISFVTLVKIFTDTDGDGTKQEVSTKGLKVVDMPTEKKLTIYCKATAHFNVFISLCLNRTSEVNKWTLRDKFQTSFQNLKTIVIAKRQYFLTYDRNSSSINTCCQFWMAENGEWKFLREPPFITDNYQLAKCGELIFLLLSAAEEKIATDGRSVFGPSDSILYYYDCDTQKWYSTPTMPNLVQAATLVSDSTSILYVIGGLIAPQFKKTVTWIQTFDVKNSTWDEIYPKLESSLDSSYCEYDQKTLNILYGSACHYANNLYISYVDEKKEFKIINYDIRLRKFNICSTRYSRDDAIVSKNQKHELIMYKSKLYAIDNGPISTVDKYQLTNNRWIKETPIPKKITNSEAEAILTSDLTAAAVVADYYG